MKSLAFLFSTNTLFGLLIGSSMAITFAFRVLADPPACAISLDKMNVFYIGVDNPVTMVARGIPMDQLAVGASGITIKKNEGDQYTVRATTPGEASITVSNGDSIKQTYHYRVKRIPDPALRLGNNRQSALLRSSFVTSQGLSMILDHFDFDTTCDLIRYKITRAPKDRDPVTVLNAGAKFGPAARTLVNRAEAGDQYLFEEIKVRCPGDLAPRDMGSLSFTIQ